MIHRVIFVSLVLLGFMGFFVRPPRSWSSESIDEQPMAPIGRSLRGETIRAGRRTSSSSGVEVGGSTVTRAAGLLDPVMIESLPAATVTAVTTGAMSVLPLADSPQLGSAPVPVVDAAPAPIGVSSLTGADSPAEFSLPSEVAREVSPPHSSGQRMESELSHPSSGAREGNPPSSGAVAESEPLLPSLEETSFDDWTDLAETIPSAGLGDLGTLPDIGSKSYPADLGIDTAAPVDDTPLAPILPISPLAPLPPITLPIPASAPAIDTSATTTEPTPTRASDTVAPVIECVPVPAVGALSLRAVEPVTSKPVECLWKKLKGPGTDDDWIDAEGSEARYYARIPGTYLFEATPSGIPGVKTTRARSTLEVEVGGLPPVADAGTDVMLPLPAAVTWITLDGSASFDPGDGSLTHRWRVVAGPGPIALANPDRARIDLELDARSKPGCYQFELQVTGPDRTDEDVVSVIVTDPAGADPGAARVARTWAHAGMDLVLEQPADGSSVLVTSPGGQRLGAPVEKMVSLWRQVAGPPAPPLTATHHELSARLIVPGTYVYRLELVTDSGNDEAADEVFITLTPPRTTAPEVVTDITTGSYPGLSIDAGGSRAPQGLAGPLATASPRYSLRVLEGEALSLREVEPGLFQGLLPRHERTLVEVRTLWGDYQDRRLVRIDPARGL